MPAAEKNVPRSGLRVNQGESVGLDLAPAQAAHLSRPASGQRDQPHRRDAGRAFDCEAAQGRAERPPARWTAAADDAGARVPGGFGPMVPRDGAVEHVAQYVMTAIRAARLSASAFVEEAGDIGAHDGPDAEMAAREKDGAVQAAQGRLHRGRLPRRRAPLDAFGGEPRQRRAGSGRGKGTAAALISRARNASAAAGASSAFAASGLPSVTRRGHRRGGSGHPLTPPTTGRSRQDRQEYGAREPGAGARQRVVRDRGKDVAAGLPCFDGIGEAQPCDPADRSVRRSALRGRPRVEADGDHGLGDDELARRAPVMPGGVAHQRQAGQKDRHRHGARHPEQEHPPQAAQGDHGGPARRTLRSRPDCQDLTHGRARTANEVPAGDVPMVTPRVMPELTEYQAGLFLSQRTGSGPRPRRCTRLRVNGAATLMPMRSPQAAMARKTDGPESPPRLKATRASVKDRRETQPRKGSRFGISHDSQTVMRQRAYARWLANDGFDGPVGNHAQFREKALTQARNGLRFDRRETEPLGGDRLADHIAPATSTSPWRRGKRADRVCLLALQATDGLGAPAPNERCDQWRTSRSAISTTT